MEAEQQQQPQSRSVSKRRASRGRGRKNAPVDNSDNESVRSDVSQAGGGRRNRQRTKKKQQNGGLDGIIEGLPVGGELVGGASDVVQNTAGQAVNKVGDTAGKTVGGLTSGGQQNGGSEEKGEQLRLRLELNLDIEIQLKAKIHGDLTLGLLSVLTLEATCFCC